MEEVFISDKEVKAYERRSDPARRAVVWSITAVVAAFLFIGGAYAFGYFGMSDNFAASLLGGANENGETLLRGTLRAGEAFPLWSAGREEGVSFAQSFEETAGSLSGACGFEDGGSPSTRSARSGQAISLLLSEIAWMGTEEGAQYEWIEIVNAGDETADIGGWSVVDKDEQIQFVFPKSARIPAGGFMLLARSADTVDDVHADYRYTGNLKNEDEGLKLFNANCEVVDEVLAAPRWSAGESAERRTMERNPITKAWYTSSVAGGTPRAANSEGRYNELEYTPVFPVGSSSAEYVSPAASTTANEAVGANSTGSPQVVISEVMAGKDGMTNWDFVELKNEGAIAVDLTGWSVKKKSSSGSESALVAASRVEGKIIPAGGYLLLAHPDYTDVADVVWPKSYALAYTNNAVVLYDADHMKVDEILWTEIPKGQSYAEINGVWAVSSPTPGR